ncbi:hypothetical protein E6H29_02650 [Candidatus Bathyarchaeota archaeon]|nr:MAG: hypothetical protein AUJ07_01260 [Crenarchaeota archaeon 13_1_40CM_3_53_5]TMI32161.1 MAG: hypothetical protein E6H29_02650 [Candidatus Bathyarchaeota archaeon]
MPFERRRLELNSRLCKPKSAKAEITRLEKMPNMAHMLDMKSFFAGMVFGIILGVLLGIILEANFFFLI